MFQDNDPDGGTMDNRNHSRLIAAHLAFLCILISLGCYPEKIGPIGPDGKRLTWDMMNSEQRKAHMKSAVMPGAAEIFRTWRPKKYAAPNCTLCHGSGTKTGNFHMPTAHLPRLSGDWTLRPEFEKYPDTTRLKLDRLVPLMAKALGKKPFSIITRSGFGCYSCHLGPSGPMFGN
jgi:hypothetical protein